VALAKIAVEKLEQTNRPFRLAIDISIWQFQIQAGKGGQNPALRTLYYRLIKLLGLSIQPLFVFDGLNKPPFKRNAKTNSHSASLPNMLAKTMLDLFGFPYLTAPGEAEAECALLQKEGIVDAVLSEDVDTLMFGSTMTMRNWTSEGARGNKSPTHVNVYYSKDTKEGKSGLDREGMILVALMSGGDYIPAGIEGCGVKTACEAARAGFGHELCKLPRKDAIGLRQWKERLEYELQTNESGYFRVKHKKLKVPQNFPDRDVLGYYTHPVVSSVEKVSDLRNDISWHNPVNVQELRQFVADAFEWQYLGGAFKYVRGLAPALLVQKLRIRAENGFNNDDIESQAEEERESIEAICGQRVHFSTDGVPELRVNYIPANIVGLDFEQEETEEYVGVIASDSEIEEPGSGTEDRGRSASPQKRRGPSKYDPTQPEKIWILETFAKLGVPLMVETREAEMRRPKKATTRKVRERDVVTRGGMPKGALDAFVKVTKPSTGTTENAIASKGPLEKATKGRRPRSVETTALPVKSKALDDLLPEVENLTTRTALPHPEGPNHAPVGKVSKPKAPSQPSSQLTPETTPKSIRVDPWTLARRPSDTFDVRLDKTKKYSALGINCSPQTPEQKQDPPRHELIDLCSSPPGQSHDTEKELQADFAPERDEAPVQHEDGDPSNQRIESPTPGNRRRRQLTHGDGKPARKKPIGGQQATRHRRLPELAKATEDPPASSSPSLPSLSTMIRQPPVERNNVLATRETQSKIKEKASRTYHSTYNVIPRSSLPGAWKVVDHWEMETITPNRVLSGVDTLDMTRS
jgi:Holliday junction resolvase YEN1